MKKLILVITLLFIGFSSQSQEVKKKKNTKATIEVKGNCGMCQKRIEKAAMTVKGVKSASWDVDSLQLSLIFNEQKCSVLDVKKAVATVGHDTDAVKASKEVYDNLHGCCQYERK